MSDKTKMKQMYEEIDYLRAKVSVLEKILLCLKFAAGVSGIIYKKKAQCFVANAHGTGG